MFGYKKIALKLVMHRWTPKQIELAQNLGQRIYVDIDDDYESLTEANKAYEITHPDNNPNVNREHYKKVILAADVVTVSTPRLHDIWSQRRNNVILVRNGVNLQQFHPAPKPEHKPVLGWVGATDYRNNDLEQLRDWLPDLLEEHDLAFHHAGHSPDSPTFAELTGVDPRRITTSPILPITRYSEGFRFDIGLVPLSDIPFNHAKSNIKGLEYAAAGIPFVASDLPEYRLLHESGAGRIAQTADDWITHILGFLDYRTRRYEARIAREIVAEYWSIEARAEEWNQAFNA